jgi:hypothetical protein
VGQPRNAAAVLEEGSDSSRGTGKMYGTLASKSVMVVEEPSISEVL